MADDADAGATVQVTVLLCVAACQVREWTIELPLGATVADALRLSGAQALLSQAAGMAAPGLGVWGRAVRLDARLKHLDRVEVYRPLKADPKLARRARFALQGVRKTGLFARQRPGGKPG